MSKARSQFRISVTVVAGGRYEQPRVGGDTSTGETRTAACVSEADRLYERRDNEKHRTGSNQDAVTELHLSPLPI